MAHPHIVEFNQAFVTPLTTGDGLDITKLLEFTTNFVVIDGLTGSRIPQRDDQGTLKSVVGVRCKKGYERGTPPDFCHGPVPYGRL
jgi:hypothetical protein